MRLHYRQKENGIYILSKNDIEDIAESVLKDYSPRNLIEPVALDTLDFLENYLGLTIKVKYIGTFGSEILGLIVMNDEAEIPSLDDMFRPVIIEETYGTVLINPQLMNSKNCMRRRYTEIHEASHFLLHSEYYDKKSNMSAGRISEKSEYIACRKIELNNAAPRTDVEWLEWQADKLAAALLMPKDTFKSLSRLIIKKNGISSGYLFKGAYSNKRQAYQIISEVAGIFSVSYRAAQIRMIQLGLIKEEFNF